MANAMGITFVPVPVAFRVRCRTTPEQNRMMYLAARPAWEAQLAQEWRLSQSTCTRCGYERGKHAVWCDD